MIELCGTISPWATLVSTDTPKHGNGFCAGKTTTKKFLKSCISIWRPPGGDSCGCKKTLDACQTTLLLDLCKHLKNFPASFMLLFFGSFWIKSISCRFRTYRVWNCRIIYHTKHWLKTAPTHHIHSCVLGGFLLEGEFCGPTGDSYVHLLCCVWCFWWRLKPQYTYVWIMLQWEIYVVIYNVTGNPS